MKKLRLKNLIFMLNFYQDMKDSYLENRGIKEQLLMESARKEAMKYTKKLNEIRRKVKNVQRKIDRLTWHLYYTYIDDDILTSNELYRNIVRTKIYHYNVLFKTLSDREIMYFNFSLDCSLRYARMYEKYN